MLPEIKTILLAMTPINELRGTIPIALTVFHFSPGKAMFLACLGNILPIFFLLWFWKKIAFVLAKHSKLFNKFFSWFLKRTKKRIYNKYETYGNIALVLFVAIPLPITGAWTGSLAATLLGLSYWKAILLILLGIIISGVIVTLASLGFTSLITI